jgi:hypothetical protein
MQEETHHTLVHPYVPAALYFEEADIVEYVRRDAPSVYERIDGILTLVLDLKTREPIGFALKGFKNFYLTQMEPGEDFVRLTSVIEKAVRLIGDSVFEREAYDKALDIASKDQVKLHELPRAA